MMILDDRESDLPFLSPALTRLGVPNSTLRLEFGDACFSGNGINSSGDPATVTIGIERKRLPDLIKSMQDRRLSGHQLRGMARTYDHLYLFIEGMWRAGDHGAIEIQQGRDANGRVKWEPYYTRRGYRYPGSGHAISFRQVMNYLTSLELLGGVKLRFSSTQEQTANLYASLYYWFTEKDWDDHGSCNEIYAKGQGTRRDLPGPSRLLGTSAKPAFARLVAMQIPHIDGRERDVIRHFKSARAMAEASLEDWVEMPWVTKKTGKLRRLGPVAGKAAFEAWNEEVDI